MAATMKAMKLSYADLLSPNQLMEGDLINVDNEVVEVISIDEDASGDRNMGETLVNSLAERTNKMTILGKNAKYVAIPDQFTSELISPTGFTKQDAERHRKLVARKLRIDGGNNTKDPNQPVFSR